MPFVVTRGEFPGDDRPPIVAVEGCGGCEAEFRRGAQSIAASTSKPAADSAFLIREVLQAARRKW